MNAQISKKSVSNLVKRQVVVAAALASVLTAGSLVLITGSPARPEQTLARQVAPAEREQDKSQTAAREQPAAALRADLVWQGDPAGRYGLSRPSDWYAHDLSNVWADGILFTPTAPDRSTRFSIQVRDTGKIVTVDDMPSLAVSFDALIRALPETHITWLRYEFGYGYAAAVFEVQYISREFDTEPLVTRWVRKTHIGTREYLVVAESADYAAWEDDLLAMMITFRPYDVAHDSTDLETEGM